MQPERIFCQYFQGKFSSKYKLITINVYVFQFTFEQHLSFLQKYIPNFERILDQFREYKQAVPTFGAILLNEDLTNVSLLSSYVK